eukprot:scaffold2594_cov85-Cylindrotheca_fusiformis.AAC.2
MENHHAASMLEKRQTYYIYWRLCVFWVQEPAQGDLFPRHLAKECSMIAGDLTAAELPERGFNCAGLKHIKLPPNLERIEERPIHLLLSNQEVYFRNSKLGGIVEDEAGLSRKLKHRFDSSSPLNKLCYYQSYHSSEDAMMELLRRLTEDDPLAATNQTDEFGMTPLHILSLSQTPNIDMLLAVMNEGKADHMIRSRDSFGSTPMDYLCLNRMPNFYVGDSKSSTNAL